MFRGAASRDVPLFRRIVHGKEDHAAPRLPEGQLRHRPDGPLGPELAAAPHHDRADRPVRRARQQDRDPPVPASSKGPAAPACPRARDRNGTRSPPRPGRTPRRPPGAPPTAPLPGSPRGPAPRPARRPGSSARRMSGRLLHLPLPELFRRVLRHVDRAQAPAALDPPDLALVDHVDDPDLRAVRLRHVDGKGQGILEGRIAGNGKKDFMSASR